MTIAELQTWIQAGTLLVSAGQATARQVGAFLQLLHPTVTTDAELNHILDTIANDAARRKVLAEGDIQQAQRDGGQ